jgi:N6-L-threonylcarbamoyladenine synthase
MEYYLGVDTSNYTTSVALIGEDGTILQQKQLLPVKAGQKGLRQSDAVFHHTRQIPQLLETLLKGFNGSIKAVGVSIKPTTAEGSYMPCFLVGETVARTISATMGIPRFETSHQVGHILAGVVSCGKYELLQGKFIAFHVSGGTTDCLVCTPDEDHVLNVEMVASSLDLKGGQAVDRVGLTLGLNFPCGKELERLALQSTRKFKVRPTLKDGNCCLSGLENICKDMVARNEPPQDIARYCLEYIYQTVRGMTIHALETYGSMPLLYVGGVMSNSIIQAKLSKEFKCYFAKPELSCDNAVGVSFYAKTQYSKRLDIHTIS